MPKHGRQNERDEAQLREHASRASALLASRANDMRGNGQDVPSTSQPKPRTAARSESLLGFVRRNVAYIAAVAAVAVAVAVAAVALGAILPSASNAGDASGGGSAYVSPYDWTKLDRSNGRYGYIVDGNVRSRLGIDVSENQHDIDWGAVASDGVDFAMIRVGYRGATEGELYLDACYWANMDGARAAGLDVGAYFFSQARTVAEAVEEADFVLEYLNGMPLEYPIAFDSEVVELEEGKSRTTGLSQDEMTAIAEAFCKRVEQAGYPPVIYGNAVDLSRYRYSSIEQNAIWWAQYGVSVPAANIDISYWQYSNAGKVAGISVPVDMNIDLSHVLD